MTTTILLILFTTIVGTTIILLKIKPNQFILGSEDSMHWASEIRKENLQDLLKILKWYRRIGLILTIILLLVVISILIDAFLFEVRITHILIGVFQSILTYLMKMIFDKVKEYEETLERQLKSS